MQEQRNTTQPHRSKPVDGLARANRDGKQGKKRAVKKGIPVYSGTKVVGAVWGETFKKAVDGSKHFLKQPPAISFDIGTLDQAQRAGACNVQVRDRETNTVYWSTLANIREHGFKLDRGFGPQIALTLDLWTVTQRTQPGVSV